MSWRSLSISPFYWHRKASLRETEELLPSGRAWERGTVKADSPMMEHAECGVNVVDFCLIVPD